jgi:Dullard-like phosphatase family protein
MKPNIKKLFHKTLNIESIYPESKTIPSQNDISHSHLEEFKRQSSNIIIFPVEAKDNVPENYSHYLAKTLTHLSQIKDINFEYALEDDKIKEGVPKLSFDKKILLLDLDETLIHADFDEEYAENKSVKYDAIIKFITKNENVFENFEDEIEEEKTEEEEEIEHSVGIFLRNGVKEFLEEVSKYFDVGIFTASAQEYADAVISFLDPEKKLIKYKLYRNNCIDFNELFSIKDLRILKDVDLKDVILVDNSMYSFATQLQNGILINSFYCDKNDNELYNVLGYLINFILPAEDVRKVNEQFFNFQNLVNDIISINNF